jgi:hypothetical protein
VKSEILNVLEAKPWIRVESPGKGKWLALFRCLVCNIDRNCGSRNGIAKRLRQHWRCGFNPNL